MNSPALLLLADGTRFLGRSIGADGFSVGEVVFNTAMTGYQEILTDPSYARQLVTLTYPHIGNVGINPEDMESSAIHAGGLIVRDVPMAYSNFRATRSLTEYLVDAGVVGIADIDTRQLTRVLRDGGAQAGVIIAGDAALDPEKQTEALAALLAFPGLAGLDLAKTVTTAEAYPWTEGSWVLGEGHVTPAVGRFHVVAYDFGVKHNILRMLVDRGCRVTVVPAQTPAAEVLALAPDGVFLSNGPGDPGAMDAVVNTA
ncbi:MAG: carbamoyl phosphate synthase small subunit, partial [Litorivicinaceae bacterium]